MAPRGLIVDWGGVLTAGLDDAMGSWARRDGVQFEHFQDVMRHWLGTRPDGATLDAAASPGGPPVATGEAGRDVVTDRIGVFGDDHGNPVHALERGEMDVVAFEQLLADALAERGSTVEAAGLLTRVLSGLDEQAPDMLGLVRRARRAGLHTALLSNSWGNTDAYPREHWPELFDAVVISGEVGMRKPEHRIYRHAAELIGLEPAGCVMVDDLAPNVRAAVEVGMVGVLHRDYDQTVLELEAVFDVPLR